MTQQIEHVKQLLTTVRGQVNDAFRQHQVLKMRMEVILDAMENAHAAGDDKLFYMTTNTARKVLRGES